MTVLKTDVGNLRESARHNRFEPVGAVTATDVQKAIESVSTTPQAVSPTNVTAAAYNVLQSDTTILVNRAGAVTINLQAAAARLGVPLTIKDISGNADANNITILGNGAELIDAIAGGLLINSKYGGFKLAPTTGGWMILP